MLVQYALVTRIVTFEIPSKERDGKCARTRQVVQLRFGPLSPNHQPPSLEVANVLSTQ